MVEWSRRLVSNTCLNDLYPDEVRLIFFTANVRVGICTNPILRNGIKFAVVAWAEELKRTEELKKNEVPCLVRRP